jgi:hypothetical protein
MKSSAHLYLPWPVIAEWLTTSKGCQLPEVLLVRPRGPMASVERLEGGCVLYRLTPGEGRHEYLA